MDRNMQKKMLSLALPIMLSNLITQVQTLIDKIFLGKLDITNMSAVGNATAPMVTTMNVVFSLSIGANVLISQAIGADDKERAKRLCNSLFKFNNIISILLFFFWYIWAEQVFIIMGVSERVLPLAVVYAKIYAPCFLLTGLGASISVLMQVSERTMPLVAYGIIRAGTNIVLDYAMIFGNLGFPKLGIAGAALATTIAEYLGMLFAIIYVIYAKNFELKPSIKEIFTAPIKPYVDMTKVGVPSALEDFAWSSGNLYLIVMLNHVSDVAAGVYSVVFNIECIPVVVFAALSTATITLSGQETGKRNYKGVGTVVKIAYFWCVMLALVILICFKLFPSTIMSWFTKDLDVIAASAVYLLIVGIDLFPKSGNMIVGSGIKGYGATRWMLGTQIFGTVFIIGLSSLMVLKLGMGMAELFVLVVADETIRVIINSFRLRMIVKKPSVT